MGTSQMLLLEEPRVQFNKGPVRARVLNDLSAEEKERYKLDHSCNLIILLRGESQLYDDFEHFYQSNGESIQDSMFEKESNSCSVCIAPLLKAKHEFQKHKIQAVSNTSSRSINPQQLGGKVDKFVVVHVVHGRLHAIIKERLISEKHAGNGVSGRNVKELRIRGGMINPWSKTKPIQVLQLYRTRAPYTVNVQRPKRLQDSDYFKGQDTYTNASPERYDLALNVDIIFEADDVMHSTLMFDEGPTSQTMVHGQISHSEDPIFDEAGAIIRLE
ncbi:hypothetical protein Tco_0728812 [Tanacetum coccineum]|uniref:Uncharacterized protein n=1 Tax=Tanacetum coccineum TaxID=301880 RepID=A0ABQ4YPJ9_9ASTR